MKQFLKIILIYVLIVATITVSVNVAYKQNEVSEVIKFNNVPYGIQISNFGSSHGLNSFNYSDINSKTCFNFALSSQDPSYDYRILKNYLDHMESGGTVFLPISYFSFFGPPDTERDNFLSKNKRYYDFLPKELIKEYNHTSMFYERYFPSLATDGIGLFTTLFMSPVEDYWNAKTTSADATKHAPTRYQSHIVDRLDRDGHRLYNQEEISAIYEIIQLCREHNIEPILVTTPFLSEFLNVIQKNDPRFFQDFYGTIEEIQSKTGVKYYDYSTDERFSSSYHLFFNSDHLNREGARQFTNILIEETLGK